MRRVPLILLCGVLTWSSVAFARYLGPTVHGYFFHAAALPFDIYLPDQLASPEEFPSTATLIVHVLDVNHKHADGMPVTFQLLPKCKGVATLSATRVITHNGKAQVTVSAQDVGVCHIAIRVDNVTREIWVDVNSVPDDDAR